MSRSARPCAVWLVVTLAACVGEAPLRTPGVDAGRSDGGSLDGAVATADARPPVDGGATVFDAPATSTVDATPPRDGATPDSRVADARVADASGPTPDAPVTMTPDAPITTTPDARVVTTPDAPVVTTPDAATTGAMFPLRIDSTGRRLEDQQGRPFYMVGEAAWSMIVRLTSAELDTYLADRRAKGFNTLLVELIEHKFGGPANRAGQLPFTVAGDVSTPNDGYFDQAHDFVQRAADQGFLVLLTPMYLGFPNTDEGWYVELNASGVNKARAYGAYVAAKFNDLPNVIWVEGGDRPPDDAVDEVNAIAAELASANAARLQTAHSVRFRSAVDDYNQSWLGINTTYSDCTRVLADLQNDVARVTTKPSFFLEGRYENENGATTACLVAQPYYALVTGQRGHIFGNNPIWLFAAGWPQALDSTGSRIMQHQAALLASRPLGRLVADTQVVTGSVTGLAAARDQGGQTAIALVPTGNQSVQVTPSAFTDTSFVAWWFDPVTGNSQSAGEHTGVTSLTSPSGGPWVLVLDRSDAGFPPPG